MSINNIDDFETEQANEVDLREILFKYLNYWRWFVLSVTFFLVLGYIYAKLQTPLYKIETNILIKDNKGSLGGQADLLKDLDLFTSNKIIDNEIQILKSYTLMEKVVRSLGLTTSYYMEEGLRKQPLYQDLPFKVTLVKPNLNSYSEPFSVKIVSKTEVEINGKRALMNRPVQTGEGLILVSALQPSIAESKDDIMVKFNKVDQIIQNYTNNVKIDPASKQATVLIINLEDALPQRGKDILNQLVEEYNQAALDDKNEVTANTLSFIEERLNLIQRELSSVEKNVENYKSSNQITDIGSESKIFLETVQANDAQQSKVQIQLGILDNLETYLESNTDEYGKLPSMMGIEDPTLLGLVAELGGAQLKRQSLLRTIPETNPVMSSINDQIRSLKQTIDETVKNIRSGLQVTKRQLELKNSQFESTIRKVPAKERGLLDVMRQQEIKNNLFTYLLQKREESALSLASNVSDSRIIDKARSTPNPVKPVKKVIYLGFFLIGLLIPFGTIYIKDLLDIKVGKRQDIEQLTSAPILAEIAHSEDSNALLVVEKPRSIVAEQIRSLRTNLQFISADQDHKVLLFTSNMSGEGKSFVSLNLGASVAMSGKKVVILELDLRKPKLHAGLSIDNTIGLSNYLIGKVGMKEIVKPIPQLKDYFIITCGPIPPNPAELLTNGKIPALIAQLKQEFDFVILDAPPVGLVTDAQILAPYADATLFIVRHRYSIKNSIRNIDQLYRAAKFKNMNIIFNSIEREGAGYGYGYGYGYGSGYYEESTPKKKSFFNKIWKS